MNEFFEAVARGFRPKQPVSKTEPCKECSGSGTVCYSCCGDDIKGNDFDFVLRAMRIAVWMKRIVKAADKKNADKKPEKKEADKPKVPETETPEGTKERKSLKMPRILHQNN